MIDKTIKRAKSNTDPKKETTDQQETSFEVDRREFLGGMGGAVAVGAVALGTTTGAVVTGSKDAEAMPKSQDIAPTNMKRRQAEAFKIRVKAARNERKLPTPVHLTNGDEGNTGAAHPYLGNWSRGMEHNAMGEVDIPSYEAFLAALQQGTNAAIENLDGDTDNNLGLVNPLGGLTYTMDGPDSAAVPSPPPPSIMSAEWAFEMAELYWMALCRDVAFADYGGVGPDADLVAAAAAHLDSMPGKPAEYGTITTDNVFRLPYPDVDKGPMVSQFLLQDFLYDGIEITPMREIPDPATANVTTFAAWLAQQRGFGFSGPGTIPGAAYLRDGRGLGHLACRDRINSVYVVASGMIGGFGAAGTDAANPYHLTNNQGGFATFGLGHLSELVGKMAKSERHAWFTKWYVNRFIRPDMGASLVHRTVPVADGGLGLAYPLHPSITSDADWLDLLSRVFAMNAANPANGGTGTYLLPTTCFVPTHPAHTAGHAISAGALGALLKAWFDTPPGMTWLAATGDAPVVPTADGSALDPVDAGTAATMTIEGEINKLVMATSHGRNWSGVHWIADNIGGNLQGEEVCIRMLREEKAIYPEGNLVGDWSMTKFDGTPISV